VVNNPINYSIGNIYLSNSYVGGNGNVNNLLVDIGKLNNKGKMTNAIYAVRNRNNYFWNSLFNGI
jgi:hypothetical protein